MFREHKLIISLQPGRTSSQVSRQCQCLSALSSPLIGRQLQFSASDWSIRSPRSPLIGRKLTNSWPMTCPELSGLRGGGHNLAGKGWGGNYGNAATQANAAKCNETRVLWTLKWWGRREIKRNANNILHSSDRFPCLHTILCFSVLMRLPWPVDSLSLLSLICSVPTITPTTSGFASSLLLG